MYMVLLYIRWSGMATWAKPTRELLHASWLRRKILHYILHINPCTPRQRHWPDQPSPILYRMLYALVWCIAPGEHLWVGCHDSSIYESKIIIIPGKANIRKLSDEKPETKQTNSWWCCQLYEKDEHPPRQPKRARRISINHVTFNQVVGYRINILRSHNKKPDFLRLIRDCGQNN